MGKYLNVGNAGFEAVRKGIYVDKTGMISFVNSALGTMDKLICVSRPRRFGKSFAAKMLCAYYDRSCDSRSLFEGLKISKDASFKEHLNKYDVIFLDITEFTSDAFIKKETQNIVWRDNWPNLSTYFKYPQEVRRLIYTTNTIEGFNRQLRKVTKAKSVFPTDDSLLKMLYLAMMDITKKWTGRRQDWSVIHAQLAVFFADRMPE